MLPGLSEAPLVGPERGRKKFAPSSAGLVTSPQAHSTTQGSLSSLLSS